jgi:hypothetical protein
MILPGKRPLKKGAFWKCSNRGKQFFAAIGDKGGRMAHNPGL